MAPETAAAKTPSRPHRSGKPGGPWITTRKTVQYLALVIFLALFLWARRADTAGGALAPGWINLPMRLDPLLVLAHLLSRRVLLAGSAAALLVIILTLVFGRAWCGWLCPLGTVLDLFSLEGSRARRKQSTLLAEGRENNLEPLRSVKYGLLLVILVAAFFGNLTLLALDPLTILFRTLATSIWPALDQIVISIEGALYQVPALAEPVARLDGWLRPQLFPSEPVFYRQAWLFGAVFVGVILLNLVASRFWCRYLCPLGGLLGLLSKAAIFKRQVGPACKACVICNSNCPTGTIDPQKNFASDPGECTMCLDCMTACPRGGISFTPGRSLAEWNTYDPGRREALLAMGTALAGAALFKSDALAKRETPHLLRPPGARENGLLEKCVRCSECVRACPTSALQPALTEAGLEGFWTPVLAMRLGYCDYSCNACGQVCPVQAIPPLSLEEKRQQVIGKAYIDQDRCIAWSDHKDCIVCEEMCPISEKAIRLEVTEVKLESGDVVSLQLPRVERDRCIGCGICEYKCPVNGEAAIRVYVPGTQVPF